MSRIKATLAIALTSLAIIAAACVPAAQDPETIGPTSATDHAQARYLVIHERGELSKGKLQERINQLEKQGYDLHTMAPMHALTFGYYAVMERTSPAPQRP